MPVGRDPEDRRPRAQQAPERALLAAQPPTGLVDVDRRGAADVAEQPRVGYGERAAGAADDRVDRAR